MKSLTIWIPGAPESPNRWRARNTRGRMRSTKAQREKAQMCALKARFAAEVKRRGLYLVFTGPARVRFEVRRRYPLDELVNLPASLKATQDGLCKAVLPLGDGPTAPYTWERVVQIRVGKKSDEGVFVEIEEAEPGDGPRRPFSP